jgi:hypothetical protein
MMRAYSAKAASTPNIIDEGEAALVSRSVRSYVAQKCVHGSVADSFFWQTMS